MSTRATVDLDARYREEGWGRITDSALGIEPRNVESQARRVAQWAHERIEALEAEIEAAKRRVPHIEYSVLYEFAEAKRCSYNDLCKAVREAVTVPMQLEAELRELALKETPVGPG